MVIRGGMTPLSCRRYNHNPSSHVHRTSYPCVNIFHSNSPTTQRSHLVHHTEFWQTLLYFQQYWSKEAREWRLVWVVLQESMFSYPSCLQDGHCLVEFYICHPADSRYNVINQRFWFQYHTISNLQSPLSLTDTHLVCPSESSDNYAAWHKLLPFSKWLNLTHKDTFIHGPFNFTIINGHKTWDRTSQPDWDILKAHCDMFHNPLPHFDVPSYSTHVDRRAHVSFMTQPLLVNYWFWHLTLSRHQACSYCLDKKVMTFWVHHPRFFIFFTNHSTEHAKVDRACIHFVYKSVKCGNMEHDFKSSQTFSVSSPHLVFDSASLVNYFWAA